MHEEGTAFAFWAALDVGRRPPVPFYVLEATRGAMRMIKPGPQVWRTQVLVALAILGSALVVTAILYLAVAGDSRLYALVWAALTAGVFYAVGKTSGVFAPKFAAKPPRFYQDLEVMNVIFDRDDRWHRVEAKANGAFVPLLVLGSQDVLSQALRLAGVHVQGLQDL